MRSTLGELMGGVVAAGVALSVGGSAIGQTFSVGSSYEIFFPPQGCWGESSASPLSTSGACGCAAGAPFCIQSSGSAGPVLDFSMYARNTQCSCCSHPFSARGSSSFSVGDLEITATGQTGTVTAKFTMSLYGQATFSWNCSNCEANDWDPAIPSVNSLDALFGVGSQIGLDAAIGAWTSKTWTGQMTIGSTHPWAARVSADLNLGIGEQCQSSYGQVDAVALLGAVNPDGSIGPVFEFPDCPSCTADAPSIGLIDNFFYPPPGTCVGDMDGDNDTDVLDFGILAANFGRVDLVPGTDGDLDFDGDCDVFDFGLWSSDFGCGT